MKQLIKQLESKVKNCHNTNTIFDTRNYVLLDDVKKLLEAINYTHCCEEVCDCEFERIDSKRIQCIKCEMIQSRDS